MTDTSDWQSTIGGYARLVGSGNATAGGAINANLPLQAGDRSVILLFASPTNSAIVTTTGGTSGVPYLNQQTMAADGYMASPAYGVVDKTLTLTVGGATANAAWWAVATPDPPGIFPSGPGSAVNLPLYVKPSAETFTTDIGQSVVMSNSTAILFVPAPNPGQYNQVRNLSVLTANTVSDSITIAGAGTGKFYAVFTIPANSVPAPFTPTLDLLVNEELTIQKSSATGSVRATCTYRPLVTSY